MALINNHSSYRRPAEREKETGLSNKDQKTANNRQLEKGKYSWRYFSLGSLTKAKRKISYPDGHQPQPLKLNKAVVMVTETLCALEQIQGSSLLLEHRERNCKRPRTVSTEPRSSVLRDWTLKAIIAELSVPHSAFTNMVGCSKICRISVLTIHKNIRSALSFINIFVREDKDIIERQKAQIYLKYVMFVW